MSEEQNIENKESYRELGTANSKYTVLGDDLTVKFAVLESVKTSLKH